MENLEFFGGKFLNYNHYKREWGETCVNQLIWINYGQNNCLSISNVFIPIFHLNSKFEIVAFEIKKLVIEPPSLLQMGE